MPDQTHEFRISESPEVIAAWAAECLRLELYEKHGLTQDAFRGKLRICLMVYAPRVGWVVYHELTPNGKIVGSIFVRKDLRRRGIGASLCAFAHGRALLRPHLWSVVISETHPGDAEPHTQNGRDDLEGRGHTPRNHPPGHCEQEPGHGKATTSG